MGLSEFYLGYFNESTADISKYWSRFGSRPEFEGKSVLEVGCGLGALSIDAATHGATRVVALELEEALADFARDNAAENFADVSRAIEFVCDNVADLPGEEFDFILSKDVFEHVHDLEGVLKDISRRLKPGGRMYTGFGPLYNSPYGDHKLSRHLLPGGRVPIPWAHVLLPESVFVRQVNRNRDEPIESVRDYGLNKLSFKDHERILQNCGLTIRSFQVNVSNNPIAKYTDWLRRVPGLTELFTRTIYCVLEKNKHL